MMTHDFNSHLLVRLAEIDLPGKERKIPESNWDPIVLSDESRPDPPSGQYWVDKGFAAEITQISRKIQLLSHSSENHSNSDRFKRIHYLLESLMSAAATWYWKTIQVLPINKMEIISARGKSQWTIQARFSARS